MERLSAYPQSRPIRRVVTEYYTRRPSVKHSSGRSAPRSGDPNVAQRYDHRNTTVPPPHDRDYGTARSQATSAVNVRSTLQVLKIPCDDSKVCLTEVPLLKTNGEDKKYCQLESFLGYIPDLWSESTKPFKWQDRSLVTISAKDLGPQWTEDYYMYKSKVWRQNLKANPHFDPDDRVYGAVFVFKIEHNVLEMEPDTSDIDSEVEKFVPRPAFVDMNTAFGKDVMKEKANEANGIADQLAHLR